METQKTKQKFVRVCYGKDTVAKDMREFVIAGTTGPVGTVNEWAETIKLGEQAIFEDGDVTFEVTGTMPKVDAMKELDGCETWTNSFGDRFGERVCVGIEGEYCCHEGKKFKPTKKEIEDLWDDYCRNDLGSSEQISKDLEEEFGGGQ